MYINPSFRPYEPHFHHLSFGECERSLGLRAYLVFCEERGSSFKFASFYYFIQVFQVRQLFQVWKLKFFTHLYFLSQLKEYFFQTPKLCIHQTPMRPTNRLSISFTLFHPKLMKDISSSFETCFFMILHENLNLWIHVPNLSFLFKISLLHMKLVVWPTW